MSTEKKLTLSIDACPAHGFRAICLSGDGKVGSTRLTGSKCCGRWDRVQAWKVTAAQLRNAIDAEERMANRTEPPRSREGETER